MGPPAMSSECPHICSTATRSSTRSKQDIACVGFLSEKDFARLTSVKRCDVCDESTAASTSGLWLCLYPDCYMLGCSEGADHSSAHVEEFPQHAIQINIDTLRMWCYKCNKEIRVVDDGNLQIGGLVRPGRSGVSEARPCKELSSDEASAPIPTRIPAGRVGLANLGNTCYMNAALQCLLNTTALTDFFLTVPCVVSRAEKNNTSKAYLKLVEEVWEKPGVRYVAPSAVLYAMKTAHPMFRGFQQHDAQEFLRCFMDQMHEELCDPTSDHLDEDDNQTAEEEEGQGQEEEERQERGPRAGGNEDDRLDSVSLHSSGAMEDDPEEYETADSGVSEQSSASSFDGHDEGARNVGTRRKRKHTSQASHAMGDSMDTKRERGDSCSSGVNTTGASTASSTTMSTTSRSNSSLTMAHASDVELEFCDAVSGSPPQSTASLTRALCPRQAATSVAKPQHMPVIRKRRPKTYRSVVTDIFDGKLVSSVQCLTCNQVSATTETFQDLSLPIPTSETISALRGQASSAFPSSLSESASESGWLSWAWSWISGWFYGPNITLSDCLAGFFSADELKGDNMYSCEKCKKLRNGLKYSRVTELPDSLCIHLKRFRHEFSFSSKISSRVAFPLVDFDMSQWLHKDAKSKVALYDLYGVVCHHGNAGGGHYTAYAINSRDQEWYEFDDSAVTRVDPSTVLNSEAYVLFYRKNNTVMDPLRTEMQTLLQRTRQGEQSLVQFWVSKQWLNKFENFAEPGPIDNEFLCPHGGVLPSKVGHVYDLCVALPQAVWELLHGRFGGGPPTTRLFECATCRAEATTLARQKKFELEEFKALHAEFQETESPSAIYCLSSSWFRQWEAFVTGRQRDPPGAIDNKSIVSMRSGGVQVLRPGSDYLQISRDIWQLLHAVYGGGPEIVVRLNGGGVTVSAAGAGVKPSNLRLRTRSTSESVLRTPAVVPGRVKVKSESLHASSTTTTTSSPHICSDEDADY